ncbi:hypothetical protein D4R89_08595 [bacterium]|nr:MAG: hypothetical protein D4R89_08595 [bacterium]
MFMKSKFPRTFLLIYFVVLFFNAVSLCPAETHPTQKSASPLKEISIPVIHVKGSHYEVGRQIGIQLKNNLIQEVAEMKKNKDWERIKAEAGLFLQYSRKYVPEYVMEVKGAADAAGLELEDLFPSVCEEIGSYGYEYTAPHHNLWVTFGSGSFPSV